MEFCGVDVHGPREKLLDVYVILIRILSNLYH